MMKQLISIFSFFCVFFLLLHSPLSGQSSQQVLDQGKDLNVLYRNESCWGFFMHSRGFGFDFKRLKHVTGKRKRFFDIEFANMHHLKDYKVKLGNGLTAKSFYYGKLHNLAMLRVGVGMQNAIYKRAERRSVEIRMSYTLGPVIGLAKPVFLYVHEMNSVFGFETVIRQYDPTIHNVNNIAGKAPFSYGLSRMKLVPGAFAKFGLGFDFAEYSNEIRALETGIVIDYIPSGIAMLAYKEKNDFFCTLYISFVIGKKWF